MKNGKIILICYAVFFAAVSYFAVALSDAVLGLRQVDLADYLLAGLFPLKNIVGIVVSIVLTWFFWAAKNGHYRAELDEVIEELKKVTAPTKDETRVTTISVFVFVGIMIVVFFVLDLIWSNFTLLIY
ncbi:MAG TPA: preprotein translocase subunit SecE [bacterium]|nr:preprotein translocase subunit SecE [bacterium]